MPRDSSWLNVVNILQRCVLNAARNSKNKFSANFALKFSARSAATDNESFLLSPKKSGYVVNNVTGSLSNSLTTRYDCFYLAFL